jgi:site-specific DNA recombinase
MIACIYCRVSKKRKGGPETSDSVERQEELGHTFAVERGWTVRHVFKDDGISGAEFGSKRPGLAAMLAAAERGAFRVLIVSEQKSIGREAVETSMTIKRLARLGVEVFEYGDGQSLTPRNAMEKAMSSLRAFGDEVHREDTSKRNHEAAARDHARGHVVGGRAFGYENYNVYPPGADPVTSKRTHVARRIDPNEASVVVRIFELFAEGFGLKRIAKCLTAEGAPAPKPFVRKATLGLPPVGAWVPSTVRGVLRREDYKGQYVWNRTRKRDTDGAVNQRPRPEREWQRTPMPEWRIVSDELWDAVAARCKEIEQRAVRFSNGRLAGRPPRAAITNLLAGIATCGVCGGGLVVETYRQKHGLRAPHYVCARRRANGACTNSLRLAVAEMNEAVLQRIEAHALTPQAVEQVILFSEREDVADQQTMLARERKDIEKKIERLVVAVETAGDVTSLAAKLREHEARRRAIDAKVASLRPVPRLPRTVIEARLEEWRRLIRGSVTQGRTVLDRVLAGRIVFTPRVHPLTGEIDGYDFVAPTRFDRLFSGIATERPAFLPASREGAENIGAEDTDDADYGRVLERALNRAKVASPPGFEPGFWP